MAKSFSEICDDFREDPQGFIANLRLKFPPGAPQTKPGAQTIRDWCRSKIINLCSTGDNMEQAFGTIMRDIHGKGWDHEGFLDIIYETESSGESLVDKLGSQSNHSSEEHISNNKHKGNHPSERRVSDGNASTDSPLQSSILSQSGHRKAIQPRRSQCNRDRTLGSAEAAHEVKGLTKVTDGDASKASLKAARGNDNKGSPNPPYKKSRKGPTKIARGSAKDSAKIAQDESIEASTEAVQKDNDMASSQVTYATTKESLANANEKRDASSQQKRSLFQNVPSVFIQIATYLYSIWYEDVLLGMSVNWCCRIILKVIYFVLLILATVYGVIYIFEQIPVVGPLAGIAIRRFIKYPNSMFEPPVQQDPATVNAYTSMFFNYTLIMASCFSSTLSKKSTEISTTVVFDAPPLNESFSVATNATESLGHTRTALLPIGSILRYSAYAITKASSIVEVSNMKFKNELLQNYEGLLQSTETLSEHCNNWSGMVTGIIQDVETYYGICIQEIDTATRDLVPASSIVPLISKSSSGVCVVLPFFFGTSILGNPATQLGCTISFAVFLQTPCFLDQPETPIPTYPWCLPPRLIVPIFRNNEQRSANTNQVRNVLKAVSGYFLFLNEQFNILDGAAKEGVALANNLGKNHTKVETLRRKSEVVTEDKMGQLKIKEEHLLPRKWWQLSATRMGLALTDKYELLALSNELRDLHELGPVQKKASDNFFKAVALLKDLQAASASISVYLQKYETRLYTGVFVEWKDIVTQMKILRPMIDRLHILNLGYQDAYQNNQNHFMAKFSACRSGKRGKSWEDCFFKDL